MGTRSWPPWQVCTLKLHFLWSTSHVLQAHVCLQSFSGWTPCTPSCGHKSPTTLEGKGF